MPATLKQTSHSKECLRCGYPVYNSLHNDCCPDGVSHRYWYDDTYPSAAMVEVMDDTPLLPLATAIATIPRRHDNEYPLWLGPCDEGPLGGITQSMLVRFMSCRERFRLKYVLGLEPADKWNKSLGYGNMWHVCEEAYAGAVADGMNVSNEYWGRVLLEHTKQMNARYQFQSEEIYKWYNVCRIQFPEYVKYWESHPDVQGRTPLMQEQVFDVPYMLLSGRTVRLRGKFDSVDLIDGGIYLQENKTKGDIDKMQIERQLKFDLQTMMYLVALQDTTIEDDADATISGVRYNVVRRPLSGGVGNIKPHAAKSTKKKFTPAETDEEFYERLRRDYIAADPAHWFFRVRSEVSARDVQVFRDTCLDPLLEHICQWYYGITKQPEKLWLQDNQQLDLSNQSYHYRTPFGVWSALEEGGATEYDHFLESGSEAGLRRVETLFEELQ